MLIRQLCLGAGFALAASAAAAEDCGVAHTVTEGQTIFEIAEVYYEDPSNWSLIYYANQSILGGSLFDIAAGTALAIPCGNGEEPVEAAAPVADPTPLQLTWDETVEMRLVTGGNYAPFTDRDWLGEGMVTELVNAALEEMPDPVTYAIVWEDDWSQHLFPILDSKQADMGLPWLKPDCARAPDHERCANFHFSDPLVEMLVLLFEHKDRPVPFDTDADLEGRTLCRPAGYFTHDLDRTDRRWLETGFITLVQAESPDACFELLMTGEVDAVTVNEFLGLSKIAELGIGQFVQPVQRPLSIEGLHVITSKRHWRGTTFLYRFNAGLAALRASDRYDEIVSRHLDVFWSTVGTRG